MHTQFSIVTLADHPQRLVATFSLRRSLSALKFPEMQS